MATLRIETLAGRSLVLPTLTAAILGRPDIVAEELTKNRPAAKSALTA